ncbi:MAG: sigma-E factor negative regulatory protein [Dokdonella sp.]
MNHDYRENLSALMDGELGKDELRFLLRRLEADPDLATQWSHYHVVRQTLRRQEVLALRADFSEVIFARLQAEAVPARQRLPLLRWASGGAIAAAVAVAALMVTQPGGVDDSHPETDLAATGVQRPNSQSLLVNAPAAAAPATATTSNAAVGTRLASGGIPAMTVSTASDWGQAGAVDRRLAPYLIQHYQSAGQAGPSNVVPYVLLASPVNIDDTHDTQTIGEASSGDR